MNAGEIGEHFLQEISCKMFQEVDGPSNRMYSMQLGGRVRLTGGIIGVSVSKRFRDLVSLPGP